MDFVIFLTKCAVAFALFWILAIFFTKRKIHFYGVFLLLGGALIFLRYQREGLEHLSLVAFLLIFSGICIIVYNRKTDTDEYVKFGVKDYLDVLFGKKKKE